METVEVKCQFCQQIEYVKKHGKGEAEHQHYRCFSCKRTFQLVERENLTLRNRLKRLNRKTLGYSNLPEMHDKVIGTFIEYEYYV
ncbi:IS1 family transposase [Xenorhabdus sp. KJ12.1]|uniref:IS1 family transposase n=1 Tax=Xenorhabdus sp. KJ12.1 TaxID=1851571 RepID=UPI000C047229|nr:IS1 family transposase [Xenorhabdus sp. KJ12.1]PHM71727.1 transposase [Xenorhabdus sp. KJ12.1]